MTITLNGTTGITTPTVTNDGAYTGDGISFADGTPSSTLVTTTGGNVGIGTSSPSTRLHVASAGTTAIQVQNTTSSGGSYFKSTNTATTCNFGVDAIGGFIETLGAYGTLFYTNGSERMRIDSSGNLLVGLTAATLGGSNSLEVKAANEVSSFDRNTASDGVITRWKKQGSTVAYFSTNTYSLPSDLRVKTNVETIGYGLDFVNALRPVQYNTTFQDQEKLSKKNFGLIAQEVEATLEQFGKTVDDVTFLEKFEPESETESRYGLGYQNLVPVLIKAVQELKAELDTVKAEVTALKGTA